MDFRTRLGAFIEAPRVQTAIIAVIVINAILLGMETSDPLMARAGGLITTLDKLCLATNKQAKMS